MSGWRDVLFQRIGESGSSGVTKNQLHGYVKRRASVSKDSLYKFIDSLCGWGILEKHKSKKRGTVYRLKQGKVREADSKKKVEAKPIKSKPADSLSVVRVFGHKVNPEKIMEVAVEAKRKRGYDVDDIHVSNFIRGREWDNLMVRISLLDHIEEQLTLMYPDHTIFRKNKITLEVQPP